MRQEIHEVTIQDIENDLFLVTGDRGLAKAQAHAFSIHYRGEIIDSVKYKRGFISADDLIYSRHVRWEHMKKHAQKLAANMAKAGRGNKPKKTAAHHIVSTYLGFKSMFQWISSQMLILIRKFTQENITLILSSYLMKR